MKCPTCQNEINEDFGLIHCSSCGEVLMVGIDGDLQVQAQAEKGSAQETQKEEEGVNENIGEAVEATDGDIEEGAKEAEEDTKEEVEKIGEGDIKEEAKEDLSSWVESSDSPLEKSSAFQFDVFLSLIDNHKKKQALEEILSDKGFLLNTEELMASIQEGQLKIKGISAVKASLLIRRVKHLGFNIEWSSCDSGDL